MIDIYMTKVSIVTAQLMYNLGAIIQTFVFLTKMLQAVSMGHNAWQAVLG